MRIFYCLCFILISLSLPAYAEKKIVYMTVAKGGSHLIQKAIGLITQRPFRELPSAKDLKKPHVFFDSSDPTVIHHHLVEGYEMIRCDTSGKFCIVVMVRDPRDVIVSMFEWVKVIGDTPLAKEFLELPEERQIAELIEHPNLNMNGTFSAVFDTKTSLQEALKWIDNPSVLLCRFEDLVGPLGGGTRTKQIEAVRFLALHLGEDLSEQKVEEIADSLFGDTFTFRQGQISSWREVFTPYHKELFKRTMGEELILLGYEPNNEW